VGRGRDEFLLNHLPRGRVAPLERVSSLRNVSSGGMASSRLRYFARLVAIFRYIPQNQGLNMQIISDETIRELLREASFRSDSIMVSVCRAALFGCSDARNQLLVIFRIMHRAEELGGRLEEAMLEVDARDLEVLRKAVINGFEPT